MHRHIFLTFSSLSNVMQACKIRKVQNTRYGGSVVTRDYMIIVTPCVHACVHKMPTTSNTHFICNMQHDSMPHRECWLFFTSSTRKVLKIPYVLLLLGQSSLYIICRYSLVHNRVCATRSRIESFDKQII